MKLVYQFKAAYIYIAVSVKGKKGINVNKTVRLFFFLLPVNITLSTAVLELMGAVGASMQNTKVPFCA